MWKWLLSLLSIAVFSLAAAQSASLQARAAAQALFYAGAPSSGGRLVARTGLEAAAQADLSQATHVVLEVAGKAYTFAIAQASRSAAEVQVAVNGTARTLAGVAAELQVGLAGKTSLAIFTKGSSSTQVVAIVKVDPRVEVRAGGSTQVSLLVGGQEKRFTIERMGRVLADVTVEAGGRAEALLKVAASLSGQGSAEASNSGTSGNASSSGSLEVNVGSGSGSAGASGGVNIGIGIGVGVGGEKKP
jgi:hypothetical protein